MDDTSGAHDEKRIDLGIGGTDTSTLLERIISTKTQRSNVIPSNKVTKPQSAVEVLTSMKCVNNLIEAIGTNPEMEEEIIQLHTSRFVSEFKIEVPVLNSDALDTSPIVTAMMRAAEASANDQERRNHDMGLYEIAMQADCGGMSWDSWLNVIGMAYSDLFLKTSRLDDANKAIMCLEHVTRLTHRRHPYMSGYLCNLGNFYRIRFRNTRKREDIEKAIECQLQAATLLPRIHEDLPSILNHLGNSHNCAFEYLGTLDDINKAIKCHSKAVGLISDTHPEMPGHLTNLANSLGRRFDRLGNIVDIDQAIEYQERSLALTTIDHPSIPEILNELGIYYRSRFEHLGRVEDVESAIKHQARAVNLSPAQHDILPKCLHGFGNSYLARFQRLGNTIDIGAAIECYKQAISLIPIGHADIPGCLNSIGCAYRDRFRYLGSTADLDQAIELQNQGVELTPRDSPHLLIRLYNLGVTFRTRFDRIGHTDDIDKAILHHADAMSLTPDDDAHMPNILIELGNSLSIRFSRLGRREDIDRAIGLQTRGLELTPNGHTNMANHLNGLGNSHHLRFEQLGDIADLERSIDYHSKALSLTPNDHTERPGRLGNLSNSLHRRFEYLAQVEDIDRAIEYHLQAIEIMPDRHTDKPGLLSDCGHSYLRRFDRLGMVEDLDKAIEMQTRAVRLASSNHILLPNWLSGLGNSHQTRFEYAGRPQDIDTAIKCLTQAVELTQKNHTNMPRWLNNLGHSYYSRFERFENIDDINKAIQFHSQALQISPRNHPELAMLLCNLGNSYSYRFTCTRQIQDIEAGIQHLSQGIKLTHEDHPFRANLQYNLGLNHYAYYKHLKDPDQLEVSLKLFQCVTKFVIGNARIRFDSACRLAEFAPSLDEKIKACQIAMDLIPHVIWLGVPVGQRYKDVSLVGRLALNSAAAAIQAQNYPLAIEWLEQGRSIVWGQMLQLRAPFDELSAMNPTLSNELQILASQLRMGAPQTRSSSAEHPLGIEHGAQRYRRLAEKYEQLVKEIHSVNDFKLFLEPKKAPVLLGAAQEGPVVVINISNDRCDALVLMPSQEDIKHVPLPSFSYKQATECRNQMERCLSDSNIRERGELRRPLQPIQTDTVQQGFTSVLEALWKCVAKPILCALGYTERLPTDKLPRLTWCATGPLTFLPLHACGCYDPPGDKIFDYVISSYTPTLSALKQAISSGHVNHSSMLAISQENTPGYSRLPNTKEEINYIRTHSEKLLRLTTLEGMDATTKAVLAAMEENDWIHLACHAHQNTSEPIETGFALHDGTLSLATIMQKQLEGKGLAFLSACQTAAGDKKLADETVHLASSLLFAGYSSSIATMWSIHDSDAPLVANVVYAQLLKNGSMEHKNAARALHMAVEELRIEVGEREFSRWVPYIHIGR
ncbi:TPR-like protein [Rhizoctonia solani]|nr:TPR-like protein [Rhizoctonia solani]